MFLDDQHSDAGAETGAEHKRESQAPLLLHDMQTPEEAFGLPPARRRPHQLAVAVLLLVGAVVCILAMRHFGLGPAASLAGIDIDYQPKSVAGGASPKQVLADLERSRKAVQVSADHIKHDPFELAVLPADAGADFDPDALSRAERQRMEENALRARAERERVLRDSFSKLTLQSVMEGSVPVARISDQIVKVGMTVGEHFTVGSIRGREVTLLADDLTFVLTMEQSETTRPGQRK